MEYIMTRIQKNLYIGENSQKKVFVYDEKFALIVTATLASNGKDAIQFIIKK